MTQRHIMAIARKEWLHITRDPLTIFLLAIGPVLMLVLISYATATDVENVPTTIYDMDQSAQSKQLIAELDATRVLDVQDYVASADEYQDMLDRRKTRLVVIIEKGFGEQVTTLAGLMGMEDTPPKYSFIIDGTDPISAETALETALKVSESYSVNELTAVLDAAEAAGTNADALAMYWMQLNAPIATTVENRYNPDLKAIWDLVPALIAVAMVLPGMSISTVIARERSEGTLEALVATPINKHAILLGKALPYMFTSLINVGLMYLVARIVFDVPFRGNLVLYLLLASLYAFATLAIGLLFSIMIPSLEAALWGSMLFFLFPGVLLSGMFFPVDVFPLAIKIETLELPVVSGVLINRGMFLQGIGARELWWNIVLLLIIAVEGFEIAGRLFKKRIA